jgi:hypothetical protein
MTSSWILTHTRPPSQFHSWSDLPPQILSRLQLEGLDSPSAWRAAGRRRFMIFGIPTPLVHQLDALAQAVRS